MTDAIAWILWIAVLLAGIGFITNIGREKCAECRGRMERKATRCKHCGAAATVWNRP